MTQDTPSVKPAASYEAPQITDHGSLAELTAASSHGDYIDGTYPAHTPTAGHLS